MPTVRVNAEDGDAGRDGRQGGVPLSLPGPQRHRFAAAQKQMPVSSVGPLTTRGAVSAGLRVLRRACTASNSAASTIAGTIISTTSGQFRGRSPRSWPSSSSRSRGWRSPSAIRPAVSARWCRSCSAFPSPLRRARSFFPSSPSAAERWCDEGRRLSACAAPLAHRANSDRRSAPSARVCCSSRKVDKVSIATGVSRMSRSMSDCLIYDPADARSSRLVPAGRRTSASARRFAVMKSRLSMIAAVSARWLTLEPARGRQAEPVVAAKRSAA